MHGEVQIRFWEGLRKPASATGGTARQKKSHGRVCEGRSPLNSNHFQRHAPSHRSRPGRARLPGLRSVPRCPRSFSPPLCAGLRNGENGYYNNATLIRQTIDHVLGMNLPDETKQARPGGNLRRVLGYE